MNGLTFFDLFQVKTSSEGTYRQEAHDPVQEPEGGGGFNYGTVTTQFRWFKPKVVRFFQKHTLVRTMIHVKTIWRKDGYVAIIARDEQGMMLFFTRLRDGGIG